MNKRCNKSWTRFAKWAPWPRLQVGLLFALLIPICAHSYEVIDTGILGRDEIYWIDNAHVLFPGFRRSEEAKGRESPTRAVLYVWDVGNRHARVHAEIPETDYVCFADGYVSYAIRRNGRRHIREGKLGSEIEREWDPSSPRRKIERNPFTCQDMDLTKADEVYKGFLFLPLRRGDGYYGWKKTKSAAEADASPMYFLRQGGGEKPAALPFTDVEKRRITYSEYEGAYVVERSELTRRNADTAPGGKAWLVFPTGKVTDVQIKDGPWLRATWGYAPTRKGWVIASRSTGRRSQSGPGDAGIYLLSEGSSERLIAGFPSAPALSPDGCRIAAIVNPLTGPGLKATLRVVNLCR